MSKNSKSIRRWNWFYVLILILAIGILGFLGFFGMIAASVFRWTGESKQNYMIDNLRFIDAAKNQWAIEHGITNDEQVLRLTNQPTEQDIIPYLGLPSGSRARLADPIAGEICIINSLNVEPGVKLTRKVGTWPKGSIFSLEAGGKLILPSQTN